MEKFEDRVSRALKAKEGVGSPHDEDAFNHYLHWFLANYRVQIIPDAYPQNILDEPLLFDKVATLEYNKLLKGGRQTPFARVVNFVVRLGCLHVCTSASTPSPVLHLFVLLLYSALT
jgi:hypothetical protein